MDAVLREAQRLLKADPELMVEFLRPFIEEVKKQIIKIGRVHYNRGDGYYDVELGKAFIGCQELNGSPYVPVDTLVLLIQTPLGWVFNFPAGPTEGYL